MRLLIVEDDVVLAEAVADILATQHYVVDIAADGQVGWELATTGNYELIVLDVILPKLDGISLCQQLRQANYQMPILLLTAKDSGTDRVIGLDAGADDYVIKPFDFQELAARIRALLRRVPFTLPPVLEWGDLRLDPGSSTVTYHETLLHLTPTEYSLLELFLRNHPRFFNRSAIVDHLWPLETPPQEATIKSHIKSLRQKLKAAGAPPDLIETVYGLGYRLKPLSPQPTQNELTQDESTQAVSPTAHSIAQQTQAAIEQARENLKAKLGDRLASLQQAAQSLRSDPLSASLRQQAEQEAHKLAGTLGTFELTESSHLAEAIEDLLLVNPMPNSAEALQLQTLVNQLCQTLESQAPTKGVAIEPVATREVPLALLVSYDSQATEQLISSVADRIQVARVEEGKRTRWTELVFEAIAGQQPDIVLLDLNIAPSQQDGLLLLDKLSQQTPTVPILMFTDWHRVMQLLQKLSQVIEVNP
jgi:DNA-binding response OmpR family regulator